MIIFDIMFRKSILILLFISSAVFAQTKSESDSLIQDRNEIGLHPRDQYKMGAGYVEHPLKPPLTTSPRATLYSFIEYMNRAYTIVKEAHKENLDSKGLFGSKDFLNKKKQAEILGKRAIECLDLSHLPQALKKDLSYERALQLKEILDRIELPHFTAVPDEFVVEQKAALEKGTQLDSWQIPNADIVISRIEDGPRKGEYLFNVRTVKRLPVYYNRINKLAYNESNEVSEGFYEFYISSPGELLPPIWVGYLPDSWYSRTYFSQTIWQWVGLFLTFFLAGLAIRFLFLRLLRSLSNHSTKIVLFRKGIFLLACVIIIMLIDRVDIEILNITGSFFVGIRMIFASIMWFLLAAAVYFFINALSENLINLEKIRLKGIQRAYTKILTVFFSTLVAILIFLIGLYDLGVSVIPLITGAGIGGIAIALAAKSTLENVISSFSIFANTPFRLGHEIEVGGFTGTVIDIGLSKTKLRQLDGRIAIIPNKLIIDATVENIYERPFWKREFEISISYPNDPKKVHTAVNILKAILSIEDDPNFETKEHPNQIINNPDHPPKVHFQGIKDDNQILKVDYWYCDSDKWAYRKHEDYINFRIIERFKEAGIEFAIPSLRLDPGSGQIDTSTDENRSSTNPQ